MGEQIMEEIENYGTLNINNSTISNNHADDWREQYSVILCVLVHNPYVYDVINLTFHLRDRTIKTYPMLP